MISRSPMTPMTVLISPCDRCASAPASCRWSTTCWISSGDAWSRMTMSMALSLPSWSVHSQPSQTSRSPPAAGPASDGAEPSDDGLEGGDGRLRVLRRAHTQPQRRRSPEIAGDDALAQQLLEHFGRPLRLEVDEVGVGRGVLDPQPVEARIEVGLLLAVLVLAAGDLGPVVERVERADLGHRVDVERLAYAVDRMLQRGGKEPVADTRAGERVDLGEGAAHRDGTLAVEVGQAVRVRVVGDELEVGIVDDYEHVLGQLREEGLELGARVDLSLIHISEPTRLGMSSY